jgi:hypothetical protein
MTRRFDEEFLERVLDRTSPQTWILFAASCGQRMYEIFKQGEAAWGWRGRSQLYQGILDICWSRAARPGDDELRVRLSKADWRGLLQDIDDDDFSGYRLFVYPPMGTLEAAVDCAVHPTVARATRCAQTEYNAMAGIADLGVAPARRKPGMMPREARAADAERRALIHEHPIVQECLKAQQECLDRMLSANQVDRALIEELRSAANVAGGVLLSFATETFPRRTP